MSAVLRLLLPAAILGLCACGGNRPGRFFPIGIYSVNTPEALARLRRDGFNAAQTYDRHPEFLRSMAKAARQAGVKLMAEPFALMTASTPVDAFPMAAWYLVDEPDVWKIPASEVCARSARVRSWAPAALSVFVVGAGARARDYKDCADVVMVDWYPVPHLPLESAGEQVRLAKEAAGDKPVWAVLQAMNWRDYPQRDSGKPRIGRFPDIFELRFMSYHAILEGARGIWYYAYSKPNGMTLVDVPEEWFAVTSVVGELAAMRPIFERGEPAVLPFEPKSGGVLAKAWRYRGRDYVVIASPRRVVMSPVPQELLGPQWRPLFEPRRDQKELFTKVGDGYYLPPYRVMVLEGRLGLWRPGRKAQPEARALPPGQRGTSR